MRVPYPKIKVELSRFAVRFCFGVKCFDTMQETGTHTFLHVFMITQTFISQCSCVDYKVQSINNT